MTMNPLVDLSEPFARLVTSELTELIDSGFAVVEAGPTIVRFARGEIEIDVYWGRRSYEVGAGVAINGERYALSELMYLADPDFADKYRNSTATSVEVLSSVVGQVANLLKTYAAPVFVDPAEVEARLQRLRPIRLREMSLDSQAHVFRPQAEEAFRRHDFAKAAEIYSRIEERLSPAEVKKLAYARSRSAPKS